MLKIVVKREVEGSGRSRDWRYELKLGGCVGISVRVTFRV